MPVTTRRTGSDVTRGGRVKERDEPERRCIVTRETGPKTGLVRFVVGPDDEIVPDLAGRLPGRGMYVAADAETLRTAVKKGHFARAAKQQVKVPPDLAERVEALLAARLTELVSLARKAGESVCGLEKTTAALVSGEAVLLLQAADGSERERARLRPPAGENSLVTCLSAHELGLAFARDRVIHAAVLAGGLGDRIRDDALRLSGIRDRALLPAAEESAAAGVGNGSAGEGSRGKG
nr:RNA-binding protein [Amaricoccus macauensis]